STTKFDLTLQIYENESGLDASFEYATELFDRSTIERLAGCFLLLLKGIAVDPDRRVARLPLLDDAEQQRLLINCNTTATVYPRERLAFMAQDANLDALVVAPGGAPVAGLPTVRTETPHRAHHSPSIAHGGAAVAYIMYTSGSTGVPKGIAVPHRAIARLALGTDYIRIAPGDRVAQLASPSFDAMTFELWSALLNGASLVIIDRDTVLSSQLFTTALREMRITSAFVTTALFNR